MNNPNVGDFEINLFEILGLGAYGTVYACKHKESGEKYAAKRLTYQLPEDDTGDSDETTKGWIKVFRQEITALQALHGHPNIVRLIGVFENVLNTDWFIMDYCDLGDLNKYLVAFAPDDKNKMEIMLQCTSGIEYMHSLNPPIVHRDIKPANILMKTENDLPVVKIADFGLAKIFDIHKDKHVKESIFMQTRTGSAYFMAPEFFSTKVEELKYKASVDIFSLGLLFVVVMRYDEEKGSGKSSSILPVSAAHMKSDMNTTWPPYYGMEMSQSEEQKTPMPELFEENYIQNNTIRMKMKNLIEKMTHFVADYRLAPTCVMQELTEIMVNSTTSTSESNLAPQANAENRSPPVITRPKGFQIKDVPLISVEDAHDVPNKIRMYKPFPKGRVLRHEDHEFKNILLVGETGSGKTTLVDGIFNYVKGVKWSDSKRYRVTDLSFEDKRDSVDNTESQTEWITVFSIPVVTDPERGPDFTINVIDTPGFGDTRGEGYEKEIIHHLANFFTNSSGHKIESLNAVCFVVKSPDVRLTASQKHIFQSVLQIFGENIRENMVAFATFADGEMPNVYEALDKSGVPINNKFKFNNGILFKDSGQGATHGGISKIFWDITMESYKTFLTYLLEVQPQSTGQTAEVLKKRIVYEAKFQAIQREIKMVCGKIMEKNSIEKQVVANKQEMEKNKNFKIKVPRTQLVDISNQAGEDSLYCKLCKKTCHYPCVRWDYSVVKWFCPTFRFSGLCRVCLKRDSKTECYVSDHELVKTHQDIQMQLVEETSEELFKNYNEAASNVKSYQRNIESLQKQQINGKSKLKKYFLEAHYLQLRLNEIALQKGAVVTVQDIIDQFILEEQKQQVVCFEERVAILMDCKETITYDAHAKPTFLEKVYDRLKSL